MFGLGGRWQGAGGGGVAVVEDGTAAFLNPAGLSRIRRPTAGLGVQVAMPNLRALPPLYWDTNRDGVIDERDPPLEYDPSPPPSVALQIHAGRHVGGKFGIGFTGSIPTRNLLRFQMFEPELPNYLMWNNRLERFMFATGVGGELLPGLSFGAAVDILAGGRIDVLMTADITVEGPSDSGDGLEELVTDVEIDMHEMSLAIVPKFAPVFGMQFDVGRVIPKLDGLVLGAAYHGEVGLPIDVNLDIQANATIQDVGDLDPYIASLLLEAELALFDHYVPRKVQMGLAYRRADTLTIYNDLRWTDWSRMQVNVAKLRSASLTSPFLDIDDAIHDGNEFQIILRPVWSYRMGADLQLPEWSLDGDLRYVRIRTRGGFALEPSPVVAQGTSSAILDANRTMFTLGLGAEVWDPFELVNGPVRLDAFFQYHLLASDAYPRSTDVPRAGFPIAGDAVPIGGDIVVFGAEWGFEY